MAFSIEDQRAIDSLNEAVGNLTKRVVALEQHTGTTPVAPPKELTAQQQSLVDQLNALGLTDQAEAARQKFLAE